MSKPYYDHAGIQIWLGDCRDILPTLEAGSVDLVLTDPPYGISYVSSRRIRSDPLVAPIRNDDSVNAIRDAMPLLDRVLALDRHAYLFASAMRIGESLEAIQAFWTIKNVIIWDKGDAGTVGDLEAGYAWNWEPVIYAMKGRRVLNGPRPRAIYRYDWSGTRDPVHPTVKPVGLLSWLLQKSTNIGETILDPFMGSGTTLFAAASLGRKAVGIELVEMYAEIAARRLDQDVLPLVTTPTETATQARMEEVT